MSIDAVVFRTFRKLGADDADAAAFADELNHAIDKRYEHHASQLFSRGDVDRATSREAFVTRRRVGPTGLQMDNLGSCREVGQKEAA